LIGYRDDSCQRDLDGRKVSKERKKMQDVSRGTKRFSERFLGGICSTWNSGWLETHAEVGGVPRGTVITSAEDCFTWNVPTA
jgi:hypothetical protein